MANTGSLTVVRDNSDNPLDIYAVSSPQPVLREVFPKDSKLGKFQAQRADIEELMDLEDEDMAVIHICFKATEAIFRPIHF